MDATRYGCAEIASALKAGLRLPMIAAPMFLVSGPELVSATCKAGIIGALPALNARTSEIFDRWLGALRSALAGGEAAPFAVNIIVHNTNPRREADLDITVRHKTPVIIASIGSPAPVIERVKEYGGIVLSDVATVRHARRAAESGADGLILLCAGAGGNTGWMSPFAFVAEVRAFFDGPIIVAGAISRGGYVHIAERMGADMALVGTPFIAARESLAVDEYRQMLIDSNADDIVLTAEIGGIPANMLRKSLAKTGFRPEAAKPGKFNVVAETNTLRAWRDIWSAGHGVGDVTAIEFGFRDRRALRRRLRGGATARTRGSRMTLRLSAPPDRLGHEVDEAIGNLLARVLAIGIEPARHPIDGTEEKEHGELGIDPPDRAVSHTFAQKIAKRMIELAPSRRDDFAISWLQSVELCQNCEHAGLAHQQFDIGPRKGHRLVESGPGAGKRRLDGAIRKVSRDDVAFEQNLLLAFYVVIQSAFRDAQFLGDIGERGVVIAPRTERAGSLADEGGAFRSELLVRALHDILPRLGSLRGTRQACSFKFRQDLSLPQSSGPLKAVRRSGIRFDVRVSNPSEGLHDTGRIGRACSPKHRRAPCPGQSERLRRPERRNPPTRCRRVLHTGKESHGVSKYIL